MAPADVGCIVRCVDTLSLEVDEVRAMLHGADLEITPNAVNLEIIDSCSHDDVVECGRDPTERL
jgi:hypothetical protein